MKKVSDLLNGKETNQLFPFFWQHGESNEKILEYIEKIDAGGIKNLCIESRPHPDFLGKGWWQSLDFIIAEAKKRGMKIWILDDAKFPTGYANGKVPRHLKKKYLNYHRFDIVGSSTYMELNLTCLCDFRELSSNPEHKNDTLYKLILVEKDPKTQEFIYGSEKDITNCVSSNTAYLELDKKHYSVFALYNTTCGHEKMTQDYLDPMNEEATQILIDEVYESHYSRYQDEFGHTIVGFFSDEPRFGNARGTNHIIGKSDMPLPWNEQVSKQLLNLIDEEKLIYLFEGSGEEVGSVRFNYMNIVSQLYSEQFSKKIGHWCEEHNIMYVGHVIEDNNAHARLGYGAGHYFRSMAGQHMAGIDIIGGQVVPGLNYHHDAFSTGGSDGEFYHYALCKLGASLAKLDKNKQGYLMCEAFGAYGWVEGLKMMKWITDHMISHGVNYIVPHAFDPKDFPDWDCPPHFYAHGLNPQYPYFKIWSQYANRLCYLMSNGHQVCQTAVLYHAFAEWNGETMLVQKVTKELQTHQIDCNIISEDYLIEASVNDNQLIINGYSYKVLIIPEALQLPDILIQKLEELSKHIKIIFINKKPKNYHKEVSSIPLNQLSSFLQENDINEFSLTKNYQDLVYYHYKHDDGDIYMFTNENVLEPIETQIVLNEKKNLSEYDPFENKLYALSQEHSHNTTKFNLLLNPYESLVLVEEKTTNKKSKRGCFIQSINNNIHISMKAYNEKDYKVIDDIHSFINLSQDYSDFSGSIKYEFDVNLPKTNVLLHLEEAYEIVEVIVNDNKVGTKIVPEFNFDLSSVLHKGINHIEIITTNNLARHQRDGFSMYIPMEPLGIIGAVDFYEII